MLGETEETAPIRRPVLEVVMSKVTAFLGETQKMATSGNGQIRPVFLPQVFVGGQLNQHVAVDPIRCLVIEQDQSVSNADFHRAPPRSAGFRIAATRLSLVSIDR